MRRILSLLIICSSIIITIHAQSNCDWKPLQLDDIQPKWEHLLIDSTIIGYVDTTAYFTNGIFVDGTKHIDGLFDRGSFITDDHLYSFATLFFDSDISGYMLEKIDLVTGEVVWKAIVDERTEIHDYKVLDGRKVNDKVYVYGVRSIVRDTAIYSLESGLEPSYYFMRVYDDATGALIQENTPSGSPDPSAAVVYSGYSGYPNYFYEDYWDYFVQYLPYDDGLFLLRQKVDTLGYALTELDTILTGDWNGQWDNGLSYSSQNHSNKLELGADSTILLIQQYIPKPSDPRESRASIGIYDRDFNEIKKAEITSLLDKDFNAVRAIYHDADIIILNVQYGAYYEYNFLYLDRDFNVIKYIEGTHNDNYIYFNSPTNFFIDDSKDIYRNSTVNNTASTYSHVTFYKTNDVGSLDSIRRLTVMNDRWAANVIKFFILDDGDYLIRFYAGCFNYENNYYGKAYTSWVRIDAEEFKELVDVDDLHNEAGDLSVYPNPVHTSLNITSESLDGTLNILDLVGRCVYHKELNKSGQELSIDLTHLSSGTYILQYQDRNGVSQNIKLVKVE